MRKLNYWIVFLLSLVWIASGSISCSSGNDIDELEIADPNDPGDDDDDEEYAGPEDPVPSFPGAEGGGMYTTGGRGGSVYIVTSLEDSAWPAPGTLRHAIDQSGARIIVFAVSGTIELRRRLTIVNGNLTIAGQTAPGDGITIRNHPVVVNADNVILRFLRFRMGDQGDVEGDALEGQRRVGIMIDHCSMSWGTDEVSSFYDNANFTMQWCIISESLNNSVHEKGIHGYGGIWGGKNATFHHNLIAHHNSRTPRMNGSRYSNDPASEKVDFRNNVLYNWGPGNGAHAGEGGSYNIVNNYYKPGPATAPRSNLVNRIFQPNADAGDNSQARGVWGVFHIVGNYIDDTCPDLTAAGKTSIASANSNNWFGVHPNTGNGALPGGSIDGIKSDTEFDIAFATTHTAQLAYEKVLDHAGASIFRDAVDARVIIDVVTGTYQHEGSRGSTNGIIDSQQDVGGWPVLNSTDPLLDNDKDGMPDAWEIANGLNPNDPSDAWKYNLSEEYPNLEVYLNSIVSDQIDFGK